MQGCSPDDLEVTQQMIPIAMAVDEPPGWKSIASGSEFEEEPLR
jgi:hypothetical protein